MRRASVLHLQVGLLVEAIAHVQRRRHIDNGTHGIDRATQILLDIVRTLRLDIHTDIDIILLPYEPELHIDIVAIFRTLGITAQAVTQVTLVWIWQEAEKTGPLTIGLQDTGEGLFSVVREVVGAGIALLVAVLVTVVHL